MFAGREHFLVTPLVIDVTIWVLLLLASSDNVQHVSIAKKRRRNRK